MEVNKSRKIIVIVSAAVVGLMSGCAHQTKNVNTWTTTGDTRRAPYRDIHVGIVFNFDDQDLHTDAQIVGETCAGHHYPIDMSGFFRNNTRVMLDAFFSSHEIIESAVGADRGAYGYIFVFDLERFETSYRRGGGGRSYPDANFGLAYLDMGITAIGPNGKEVLRTKISGLGMHKDPPLYRCDVGLRVVFIAGRYAVNDLLDNFVTNIITSAELDRLSQ